MREWEIEFKEYLKRLDLSAKKFKSELCLPKLKDVFRILPLRNIKEIQSLIPISSEMLLYLVRRIKTLNGLEPFKNAEIKIWRPDSNVRAYQADTVLWRAVHRGAQRGA